MTCGVASTVRRLIQVALPVQKLPDTQVTEHPHYQLKIVEVREAART